MAATVKFLQETSEKCILCYDFQAGIKKGIPHMAIMTNGYSDMMRHHRKKQTNDVIKYITSDAQ